MPLRIANAAGFLGDSLDAPRLTVELAKIDYLTLEYLAELTMAILPRPARRTRGWAMLPIFPAFWRALHPH